MAKLYGYWITVNYREAYGIYACNGILFNHESPIRGETFVTRKITRALAHIVLGSQECLFLGNLDARRDWGHAKDFVRAMWMMLQQPTPDDYVVATGAQYSVRDFVAAAALQLGMTLVWEGEGVHEVGRITKLDPARARGLEPGRVIVQVDPRYFRPAEVHTLLGDASKAKAKLGWEPEVSFDALVREMVEEDLRLAQRDELVKKHGHTVRKSTD